MYLLLLLYLLQCIHLIIITCSYVYLIDCTLRIVNIHYCTFTPCGCYSINKLINYNNNIINTDSYRNLIRYNLNIILYFYCNNCFIEIYRHWIKNVKTFSFF